MDLRALIHTLLSILFCIAGCMEKDIENIDNSCIKGRYIGSYCEGVVVEIMNESDIGKNWEGMFDSKEYTNSVVASIDTIFLSTIDNREEIEKFILDGNVFYFQYKLGGYPRKEFDICEPSSFITIFNISTIPCL
ncbi:hypothetical protein MM213_12645 [Belliella sp. R4-6]|uniref:Lipoprotein n=1 Tax=Belliella alkalica TaxID=1730871 RepID=A0ABS9VDP1_9BACT|nr:hypothetical protein [Belliella alkalica]MCH7414339.1 hypothetical protein [Belliella alkalica]